MIIYFRKGGRSIELLLAKNTLRPGMLTNGYIFMVIESDARGHLGIMPSEQEYFDLGWMASAASGHVRNSFLTTGGMQRNSRILSSA